MKNAIALLCALSFLFASCIQSELPNAEADILECNIFDMPKNALNGIIIEKSAVKIWVKPDTTVGVITPRFVISDGATIFPASGTPRNFADSAQYTYTVTSQDRKWQKTYKVMLLSHVLTQTSFDFEHYEKAIETANFHQFYEQTDEEGKQYIWASGNEGFYYTNLYAPAEEYPTSSYANGKSGRGAKLTTSSTGSFGEMVGKPIAAGNLFIGTFDLSKALGTSLTATLEAPQFGFQSKVGEPDSLKFWYKYQRGETYKDRSGNVLNDKIDNPDIYAVLYEPTTKADGSIERLNGSNITTAGNIISIAQINPAEIIYSSNIETAAYRQMSIPFVARKAVDVEKLRNGSYFLTIVFSSSAKGDLFEGAVGSTLCIDEVQLICK
jgi:hypothetical protein